MLRKANIVKQEFATGTFYTVFYDAVIDRDGCQEEIDCSFIPYSSGAAARAAADEWIKGDTSNDELAIKLTDCTFDYNPYCGADYGDVLREVVDLLKTPEGMKQIISEQLEMIQEAIA